MLSVWRWLRDLVVKIGEQEGGEIEVWRYSMLWGLSVWRWLGVWRWLSEWRRLGMLSDEDRWGTGGRRGEERGGGLVVEMLSSSVCSVCSVCLGGLEDLVRLVVVEI